MLKTTRSTLALSLSLARSNLAAVDVPSVFGQSISLTGQLPVSDPGRPDNAQDWANKGDDDGFRSQQQQRGRHNVKNSSAEQRIFKAINSLALLRSKREGTRHGRSWTANGKGEGGAVRKHDGKRNRRASTAVLSLLALTAETPLVVHRDRNEDSAMEACS